MYENFLTSLEVQEALSNGLTKVYRRAKKSFEKRDRTWYRIKLYFAITLWTVINPYSYLTLRQLIYLIGEIPSHFHDNIRKELESLVSKEMLEKKDVMPTKLKRGGPPKSRRQPSPLLEASRVHRRSTGYRLSMSKEPALDDLKPLADSGILMLNVLSPIRASAKAMGSGYGALMRSITGECKQITQRASELNSILYPDNVANLGVDSLIESFQKMTEYLPMSRRQTEKLKKRIRTLPSKALPDRQLELMKEGYAMFRLGIELRRDVLACSKCHDKSKDLHRFNMGTELNVMFILSNLTEFDEDLHKMREKHGFGNAYVTQFVKCARKKGGEPGRYEILNCLPFLKREIEICRPKMIVIIGKENYDMYSPLVKTVAGEIPVAFVFSIRDGGYIKGQDERFRDIKNTFERIN